MRFYRESLKSSRLGLSIRCEEKEIFGRTFGKYEIGDINGTKWKLISQEQYIKLKEEIEDN